MNNLILSILLIAFGHPKSFDSPVNWDREHIVDSLRVIEKVYLHTDRDYYYPGNDIWFKAYLIDASDRLLSEHSSNLHVELISPLSKIISSFVIRLEGGLGNGDFRLPDNLKSGSYRIRAYTNYMRNFNDPSFFNKEIVIISPTINGNEVKDEKRLVGSKIDLTFFPEGGSLADNVPSVLAFKATNALGKGCIVTGEVYSSIGVLVATFKSNHLGMGSFILRPIPGLSYYSVVTDPTGVKITCDLPKSFPTGVVLSASISNKKELIITAKTNSLTLPFVKNSDLLLTFSARKKSLKSICFKLRSYNNSLTLPVDDLPDGIVMMTLSTREGLLLSDRLVYIQKEDDAKINVEFNKPVYGKRDSVAIAISFSTGSDIPQEAFLSLAAVQKSFTDTVSPYPSTIASWFLLESDIRGPIEEPACYFDPSNLSRLPDLDLLLLTQGWRDFEWKYDSLSYYPRELGFTVSGRLRKYNVDKPLEADKVNIGIVKSGSSITLATPVDPSGKFRLEMIDLTGEARLVVSPISRKGRLQGLVLLDTLKYMPAEVPDNLPGLLATPEEGFTTFIQEYEIKETLKRKYKLSDTIAIGEVSIIAKKKKDFQTVKVENSRMAYDKPDAEVLITNQFYGYSNVFEVLMGRVAGVKVDKINGGYNIRIRGINSISLGSRPLFLIDGIQKSYDDLMSLPVSFIDRIDVLKSAGTTASYGVRGSNGVISIITRTGDRVLPNPSVNHSVNVKISGYDAARVFYSPQHATSSVPTYEPDFRTTLFWEPDIRLRSNENVSLHYYNADKTSTILVIVEGITTSGIPVTCTTEYKIL